jgi:outer membrane receptor protein involved in Fe transport
MFPRKITAFLFLIFAGFAVQAQQNISGTVKDKVSKKTIEFATVQLLLPKDSSIIKSAATDKKGNFVLENVQPGSYLLRSTFIGYEPGIQSVTLTDKKLDLGVIEIFFVPGTMKDVTVTATRSLLNTSIDRKIYNVNQDILAQSGSASDVLKNVPSVEVDLEGNVNLRGSGEVLILINGRPSPLMGKTRAEVLQQLPANTIERIEVITNPSARYKPDGTAGIINIVLKKNAKGGWNGSVTANAGNHDRYNGNVNLNYKPGKLNLFSSFSVRKDSRQRSTVIERTDLAPVAGFYNEYTTSFARPLSYIGTLGADYAFNDRNSIGISGNFVNRKQVKNDISQRYYYDSHRLLTDYNNRLRYDPESEKEQEASIYWQHNFKKEDHELRFEFNTSANHEVEDNHYTDLFIFPSKPKAFDNTLIKQSDRQQNLTADYTLPLSNDAQLEAGYEGNYQQEDFDFYGAFFDTAQSKFLKDVTKTNRFLYKDQQHAIYTTYQKAYDKFSYAAGIRLEQVFIKGNLVTLDSAFKSGYFKIYPTLHLAYKLKKGELQLNYSRRVNRPEGDELNPFPEYRDPLNLYAGNPKLLPELIHSMEIGYKWQNKNFSFVPSLYYRYKQNGFTVVTTQLNDSTLLTTQQNLSNDRSAGLELIFSAKAGAFFSANLSSNFFYNTIDATDLGYSKKKSIVSMSTNANATFAITKTTMLQVSSNIRSARLTPQGKTSGTFVFNTGIRQDLLNKKMSVIFTASDIFKTLRNKSNLNTSFIDQITVNRRDAQIMYLGVSYRFGKTLKKAKEENLQFENGL